MKKVFYIIFILMISCFFANAQELMQLYEIYNKKQYEKTYEEVKTYLKQKPLSLEGNLLLGNCAYKLGKYDEAMSSYDRVLMLDTHNVYAKFQEAKIYIKNNQNDMAKLELDSLLARKLTKKQKKEILKLRALLEKKSKRMTLKNNKISLGFLHDTNTAGGIGDKSFMLPLNDLEFVGSKKENDFAFFQTLHFEANKQINNSFGILGSLDIYNRLYFDMHEDDLSYLSFGVSPYYDANNFQIYIPLVFNKIFLEHDSYINAYGGGIDLKKPINNGLLEAGYRYFENRYYGQNEDKDSKYQNVYLGVRYIFLDDLLAYMYARYAKNKEKKDLRTDINYDSLSLNIGARKEIFLDIIGKIGINYIDYKYKDLNRVFLNKRKDKTYSYTLGLTYNINSSHSVDFDIIYIDKKSNQFLYEYDRTLTSIEYTYKF